MLTTGNVLLPFCIIDLGCGSGYLRDISPLKRIPLARKILLADDSVTAQNMGRKILADAGYEVITVNNGSAALKKIAETKPDLIVLDVYMPGYSGLEVCQRIKEVQETSRIPVLLTVGKLEPFKPEEAKRVRAEGFIVKPFEASELLSALAKLEDKIVPHAEPSKPGRFARANAALDEGRYDKSVAADEDSGWKDRISFPSKKKKAEPEDDANEAATSKPAAKQQPAKQPPTWETPTNVEPYQKAEAPETRVNLGALAPEGLPKDVTPEEIAALAAAAAQVKGKFADIVAGAAPATSQSAHDEPRQEAHEAAKQEPVKHEAAKIEAHPIAELPSELPRELAKETQPADSVTFAGHKPEEKIEAPAALPSPAAEISLPAASSSDVVAATSALDAASAAPPQAASGNGSGSHVADEHRANEHRTEERRAEEPRADEPMTMAAAAGGGFSTGPSRWMAVPVALLAEETAISLEHEMQKTYAAFAAAETTHTQFVASVPEIHPTAAETSAPASISSQVEAVAAEPVASSPEAPASGVIQAMSAVASAATDVVRAAVKEFEAVATSFTSVQPQVSEAQPAPIASSAPVAESVSEAPQVIEAKSEEKLVEASPSETNSRHDAPEPVGELKPEESKPEEAKLQEVKAEEVRAEEPKLEESKYEESKPQEPDFTAAIASSEHASGDQVSASPVSTSEDTADEISAEHLEPVPAEKPAARSADSGRKDSDIAATTAAAWASWRRVRESGDPKAAESVPQDAARAVAAGAETTPDPVPAANQESGDIADIVDSVLADLRPKIVEEISRKMGKKK